MTHSSLSFLSSLASLGFLLSERNVPALCKASHHFHGLVDFSGNSKISNSGHHHACPALSLCVYLEWSARDWQLTPQKLEAHYIPSGNYIQVAAVSSFPLSPSLIEPNSDGGQEIE